MNFKYDLQFGEQGETLLKEIIEGGYTVEVKRDRKISETGNIAVEVEYKGRPSGLTRTQADYYAFICSGDKYNDEVIILITTERLRKLVVTHEERGWRCVFGGDGRQSKLILVPIKEILGTVSNE